MHKVDYMKNMKELPYIITEKNVVVDISEAFSNMTEHLFRDFLEKNIEEVFSSLKVGPRFNLEKINSEVDYFLFTKFFQVRLVRIEVVKEKKKITYFFLERSNFTLDGKYIYQQISEYLQEQRALNESQERLLQTEIEKNKALERAIEMKDEFLSLISHEIRTPLNVINTAIQAMQYICKDELSSKAKKYIKIIRQNTYRQLRLVNNLLDITRADAGRIKIHKKNMDIVFLSKSITESVNNYAEEKGINLIFESSLSKKFIAIDEEKYERVLLNLLSNAIKFTPEGKSIIVKLSATKEKIKIKVKDTGIGIEKDKTHLIFEKFGQVDSSLSRQAEGAGIGLSLVKKFVEALDGSISVKSKVGEGSTFTILLPNVIIEDTNEDTTVDLMDNRLVQVATVEFSDIYS